MVKTENTTGIKSTDVLGIEDCVSHNLNSESRLTHCTHCIVDVFIPVPCPGCINVVFCSIKCRYVSAIFHSIGIVQMINYSSKDNILRFYTNFI